MNTANNTPNIGLGSNISVAVSNGSTLEIIQVCIHSESTLDIGGSRQWIDEAGQIHTEAIERTEYHFIGTDQHQREVHIQYKEGVVHSAYVVVAGICVPVFPTGIA